MDGGSLTLIFDDSNGQEKQLRFIQHIDLRYYSGLKEKLPGRIYLDEDLIEKRSSQEAGIVKFLETNVAKQLNLNQKEILQKHVEFVKSEEYVNSIPVNQKLSEVRRKYIDSINKEIEFELNPVEEKYVELKSKIISISDFEKWVYDKEELIKGYYNQSIYDDLIILQYQNTEAKSELTKILNIDFRKLELSSINRYLVKLITSNREIANVVCNDSHDYRNYLFSFNLEGISIGLLNPFKLINYHYDMDNNLRVIEFKERFRNPNKLFSILKAELNTENVRLVIKEEIADVHLNHYREAYSGNNEEIYITIQEHRMILNREFIKTKMVKYWL